MWPLYFCVFFHLCHNFWTNEDSAPQNDHLNLSFVKDIYVDGGKLARNGCKTAIFVSCKFWLSVSREYKKNQVQIDRGSHAQVPWCFGEFELLILNLLVQTLLPIRHYFLYSRAYSPKYSLRVLGDIFKATNEFETRTGLDVFFIRTLNHGFRFWKKGKRFSRKLDRTHKWHETICLPLQNELI